MSCIGALCKVLRPPLLRYSSLPKRFPSLLAGVRLPFHSTLKNGRSYSNAEVEGSRNPSRLPSHQKHSNEDSTHLLEATGSSDDDGMQVLESAVSTKHVKYNCSGCGSVLQSINPKRRGFIPKEKLDDWLAFAEDPIKVLDDQNEEEMMKEREKGKKATEENVDSEGDSDDDVGDYFPDTLDEDDEITKHDVSSFICKRCFSLQHYNSALSITLDSQDYLKCLSPLRNKKSLIVLVLDVTDFPSCVFPNLNSLLSSECSVLIVANKIDLFPRNLTDSFWSKFRAQIITECKARSLGDCEIVGVRFISVKRGMGTTELSEEIVRKWGGRGDIYLLGCTNVGKSSLFNKLFLHLCGCKPGELNVDSNLLAPKATISLWPGTTLGLLSFPLVSTGKRRRLVEQQRIKGEKIAQGLSKFEDFDDEVDDFKAALRRFDEDPRESGSDQARERGPGHEDPRERGRGLKAMGHLSEVEVENVLDELGVRRKRKIIPLDEASPQNKYWFHDTPGALNEAQLINHLTTEELTRGLPKMPITPRTFILKPGQCLFLGGLARLDYLEGPVSAYFTAFAWPYLGLHAAKIENADELYERHLGQPNSLFKLPLDFEEREGPSFPPLNSQCVSVTGTGWKQSAADVVLSSAGWVAITVRDEDTVSLRAHTPNGKGIYVRQPSLFEEAVNQRGTREKHGNRTAYLGNARRTIAIKGKR